MKRLLFRLSALTVVIVLGLITIAQAQRGLVGNAPQEPAKLKETAKGQAAPKPIPVLARTRDDERAGSDPFAGASNALASQSAGRQRGLDAPSTSRLRTSVPDKTATASRETASDGESANHDGYADQIPAHRNDRSSVLDPGRPPGGDPFGLQSRESDNSVGDGIAGREGDSREPESTLEGSPADSTDSLANFAPPKSRGSDARLASARGSSSLGAVIPNESRAHASSAAPRTLPGDIARDEIPVADSGSGDANEGSGRPGDKQLEGPQSPNLSVEKTAPAEIQVGKPAMFSIKVRNVGGATAQGVIVQDEIPKGTRLVSTVPAASRDDRGLLTWELGSLKPGQETSVQVQLMPVSEGEIGSTALVHFRAEASVRTRATKPQLALEVLAPPKVMIGKQIPLKIRISNPGSGAANGVVLTENVPVGLKHEAGNELEFDIGTLKPGEKKDLDLSLTAAQAGQVTNVLMARGDANLLAESHVDFEVIAPALKVAMTGPKRRYLERSATYNISVLNPGTAAAKDIELVTVLPKGLKFVEANNAGQYDKATHSVYWSLEELPPQESGSVSLTALPVEPGELKLQIKGQAKQGLSDQTDEVISVEGLAALQFEVVDVNDPIEVNGETTYEIKVMNQGSKAATNVQLVAFVPPEMKPLSSDGPVRHEIDGQRVWFEPLKQLAPKADTTYSLKVQALHPGDLRLKVQVITDEIKADAQARGKAPVPITKEESTRVYADE